MFLEEDTNASEKGNLEAGLIDISTTVFAANKKTWNKFLELGGHTNVEQVGKRRAFERVNKFKEMYHTGSMMFDFKRVVAIHFARLQLEHALTVLRDSNVVKLVNLKIGFKGNNTFTASWDDGTAEVRVNEDVQFEIFVPRETVGSTKKDVKLSFLMVFDTKKTF